ncbi:MAG: diguanylate cyclase [Armatimonadetes bacterium]|nr:diguanylate cyclase [Armatimonadota bacterium]
MSVPAVELLMGLLLVAAAAVLAWILLSRGRRWSPHRLVDPVTDLMTRRALDLALPQILAQAERHGGDMTAAVVELDGLDDYLARFGHRVGRDVLKVAAGIFRDGTRPVHAVFRTGERQFVILFDGLDLAATQQQVSGCVALLQPIAGGYITPVCGFCEWRPGMSGAQVVEQAADHLEAARWRRARDLRPARTVVIE